MSDQIRISDTGELETVPTTWDGEPLYSPSTVAEGLFDAGAFEQMRGQTSLCDHLPPRWLDELDPETREYAEQFECAHCSVCGEAIGADHETC